MRGTSLTLTVLTLALAACSPAPTTVTPPSSTPPANAQGDDGLAATSTAPFAAAGKPGTFVFYGSLFASCTMSTERITCFGAVPDDQPPGMWRYQVDAGKPGTRVPATEAEVAAAGGSFKHLDKGQKLVLDDGRAVCGVINSYTMACRLGEHGFRVERPSTVETF